MKLILDEKIYLWKLSFDKDLNRYVVRREGSQERYPFEEYKARSKNKYKLEKFLRRINFDLQKEKDAREHGCPICAEDLQFTDMFKREVYFSYPFKKSLIELCKKYQGKQSQEIQLKLNLETGLIDSNKVQCQASIKCVLPDGEIEILSESKTNMTFDDPIELRNKHAALLEKVS